MRPSILFGADSRQERKVVKPAAHGFYWTEGTRGIGWADNAIPPLKTGSSFGIPSPPAIWNRKTGRIFYTGYPRCRTTTGLPIALDATRWRQNAG